MKKQNKIKILIITATTITLCAYIITRTQEPKEAINTKTPHANEQKNIINFNPPTDEEKQSGDRHKERLSKQKNNQTISNANVVIVDAGQYENTIEVRAFVTNVVKDGMCKVVFSKNTHTVSREVNARGDASSTICSSIEVPRTEFPEGGIWAIEVTYASTGISGTASQEVSVK